MAADSANIVLIDIFRLLVRSGVVAALLSTQTPAASDHSINHKALGLDVPPTQLARVDEVIEQVTHALRLLRCMSPLMAQSRQVETSPVCPLLGAKRTSLSSSPFTFHNPSFGESKVRAIWHEGVRALRTPPHSLDMR